MPDQIMLSENAIVVLRLEIKGYRARNSERRLPAYRELAAAGIMEPTSKSDYRFTAWGMEHREVILERESERIERERYQPPDRNLSAEARGLLGRIAGRERITVDEVNRSVFRELAAARVIILGSSFAGGPESCYQFTYWGWKLREELIASARRAV